MVLAEKINNLSIRMQMLSLGDDNIAQTEDLTPRDLFILSLINEKNQVNVSEISSACPKLSNSTVSTILTKLWRQKGMISKNVNPDNQRETFIQLTDKGKETLDLYMKQRAERFRILLMALDLSESEEEVFIRILDRSIKFFDNQLGI